MSVEYKKIVEKVNDAFSTGNTGAFLDLCADDIQWTIVGDQTVSGKEALREFLKSMEGHEPPKLSVETLIAEGDSVMATGGMTMEEEPGCEGAYGYCDIYRFNGNGQIAELRTFVVKLKDEDKESAAGTAG
jgi:ketosteroid isomerase-like protein